MDCRELEAFFLGTCQAVSDVSEWHGRGTELDFSCASVGTAAGQLWGRTHIVGQVCITLALPIG